MANGPKKARTGVPDMRPIRVGAPSAHGEGKGAGLELIFRGIHFLLSYLNDRQQQSKVQSDLRGLERRIEQDLKRDPLRGVLLTFRFIASGGNPEAVGSPGYRYVDVMYATGRNMDEARMNQARQAQFKPGLRSDESYAYSERWFPPTQAPEVLDLRRPFRVIAKGCFVKGRVKLQNVKYTTLQGFDDEGETILAGSGDSFLFDILEPPGSIVTTHGGVTGAVKVPVVLRTVGQGGKSIRVVNLDTLLGRVTAAMVFPADQHTANAFKRAPATVQKPLGAIRGIVNFEWVRWIRPENIRLHS